MTRGLGRGKVPVGYREPTAWEKAAVKGMNSTTIDHGPTTIDFQKDKVFLLEELDFVAVACDESSGEAFFVAQIREDYFLSAGTAETDTVECTWLEKKTGSAMVYVPGCDDEFEAGSLICRVALTPMGDDFSLPTKQKERVLRHLAEQTAVGQTSGAVSRSSRSKSALDAVQPSQVGIRLVSAFMDSSDAEDAIQTKESSDSEDDEEEWTGDGQSKKRKKISGVGRETKKSRNAEGKATLKKGGKKATTKKATSLNKKATKKKQAKIEVQVIESDPTFFGTSCVVSKCGGDTETSCRELFRAVSDRITRKVAKVNYRCL